MLWQGRVTSASGDCPVRNRRVTPIAPSLLFHQWNPVWAPPLAHLPCGAEEAGMKGWRERAADIFAKQGSIAVKMKFASGPLVVRRVATTAFI